MYNLINFALYNISLSKAFFLKFAFVTNLPLVLQQLSKIKVYKATSYTFTKTQFQLHASLLVIWRGVFNCKIKPSCG